MSYYSRLTDEILTETHNRFPAVLVTGPRAVGKSTSAGRLAATVVNLDREQEAAAFRADPDAALFSLNEPVLLDEWQEVPEVLGAIKRAVDAKPQPGRFLLAGSVRADLDTTTWPGTGRVIRVRMEPMTFPERLGADLSAPRSIIDALFEKGAEPLVGRRCDLDLKDYLEATLGGGWPLLQGLSETDKNRWLEAYVDHVVTRDSLPREGRRDPEGLRRWLVAYASAVGTVTDQRRIYTAAGVAKATGEAYANFMKALYIAEPIPAWWTNELKRLAKRPKLHLIDCALLRPLSGLNVDGTLRDGSFGKILESFVVGQLRALASVAKTSTRLYHLRQFDDREVDIVLERADRCLVAIEIKATSTPSSRDAKDLRWLRGQWGERVVAAIVAHTGPAAFDLGDGVVACPIGTLLGL